MTGAEPALDVGGTARGRGPARITSFARRGQVIPHRFRTAWDNHGDDVLIPLPTGDGETTVADDVVFNPEDHWPSHTGGGLIVEIGPGAGHQIVAAAIREPQRRYLGFEVWLPGMAQTVAQVAHNFIRPLGFTPVRLVDRDAHNALPRLLAGVAVDEVWTFFPDPWPKTRHHKRRLINEAFVADVAAVLAPGGLWRIATDSDSYAAHVRDVFSRCAGQFHLAEVPRWAGRVETRYERKGLKNAHRVYDFTATRNPEGTDG